MPLSYPPPTNAPGNATLTYYPITPPPESSIYPQCPETQAIEEYIEEAFTYWLYLNVYVTSSIRVLLHQKKTVD